MRSHLTGPAFEDDGGISSEDEEDEDDDDDETNLEDEDDKGPRISRRPRLSIPLFPLRAGGGTKSPLTARPSPHSEAVTPTSPTPTTTKGKPLLRLPRRPPLCTRVSSGVPPAISTADVPSITVAPASAFLSPPAKEQADDEPGHRRSLSASAIPTLSSSKKMFAKSWTSNKNAGYNLSAERDIVGIVILEIKSATGLPRLKNSRSPHQTQVMY